MKNVINGIANGDIQLLRNALIIVVYSFSSAFIIQPVFKRICNHCVRNIMGEIKVVAFNHVENLEVRKFEY